MSRPPDADAMPARPAAPSASRESAPTPAGVTEVAGAPDRSETPKTAYGRQNWHNTVVGSHIYIQQIFAISRDKSLEESAIFYVDEMLRAMKPRDAMERMLIMQALWTHARIGRLSMIANQQDGLESLRTVHDACDRAANTFRKQLLALSEYRRPPRSDAFVAIKQANVAHQQVVTNGSEPNSPTPFTSNEVGSAPPPALPPDPGGARVAAARGTAEEALAVEHRPQDGGGEGPCQPERPQER